MVLKEGVAAAKPVAKFNWLSYKDCIANLGGCYEARTDSLYRLFFIILHNDP